MYFLFSYFSSFVLSALHLLFSKLGKIMFSLEGQQGPFLSLASEIFFWRWVQRAICSLLSIDVRTGAWISQHSSIQIISSKFIEDRVNQDSFRGLWGKFFKIDDQFDMINKMIKLQDNQELFSTFDRIASNLLPIQLSSQASKSLEKFVKRALKKSKGGRVEIEMPKRQKFHYQRLQRKASSKTVNLLFTDTLSSTQNKFRITNSLNTTSTEFLYQSKKSQYVSVIKEKLKRQKTNEDQSFLQSKPMSVFNFRESFFYEDLNLIKKKKNKSPLLSRGSRMRSEYSKDRQEVLVLQKRSITKEENEALTQFFELQDNKNIEIVAIPEKARVFPFRRQKTFLKKSQISKIPQKALSSDDFYPFKKQTPNKNHFSFGPYEKPTLLDTKNKEKLLSYHDFLWKVNFSNGLFVRASNKEINYKVFVGQGNNSNLIKCMMRRRFWWTIVQNHENSNFAWTQLKVGSIFQNQPNSTKKSQQNLNIFEVNNLNNDDSHHKIFNKRDLIIWQSHYSKNLSTEQHFNHKTYKKRSLLTESKQIQRIQSSEKLKVHNHLQHNGYIGNKKALFYMMKQHFDLKKDNVFDVLPLTFHISKGLEDPEWKVFQNMFENFQKQRKNGHRQSNIWIIKPGQCSNRGNGITLCYQLQDIRLRLKAKQKNSDGSLRTFIVQQYLQDPLLFNGRKFDIRHYLLLTCFNGTFKAYWYEEGYVRTSSSLFSLKRNSNMCVHLTNDAVQKNSQQYGKFEDGNKVSYEKISKYIKKLSGVKDGDPFNGTILPKMKEIALEAVKATYRELDPARKEFNFELLGMDFMVDSNLKPWLIEINTNPCLQLSCPLLSQLIPEMIEQTLRICVDPFFPPPEEWPSGKKAWIPDDLIEQNKFHLIFDENEDGASANCYSEDFNKKMGLVQEECQLFQSDGRQWQEETQ